MCSSQISQSSFHTVKHVVKLLGPADLITGLGFKRLIIVKGTFFRNQWESLSPHVKERV